MSVLFEIVAGVSEWRNAMSVPVTMEHVATATKNAIKTRGLKKADRKVDLPMDRKNVSFASSLFNQNDGNVESELATGHKRWMFKVLPARLSTQSKTIF